MGTTVALIGSSGALATARTPDSNASNNDPRPGVGDGLASVGASSLWGAQEVSKSGVAITRPRGGSRDCRVGVSPWCGSRFTAARGTSPRRRCRAPPLPCEEQVHLGPHRDLG